jgi:hypothetical protein
VAYPTDSGLLARAVRRIAATGRRVQAAGGATRTRVRDRSRSAGARAHAIGAKLRLRSAAGREEAQRTVARITGELAELAERAAADADRLLANARRALRRAQAQAEQLAAAGSRGGRQQVGEVFTARRSRPRRRPAAASRAARVDGDGRGQPDGYAAPRSRAEAGEGSHEGAPVSHP